MSKRVRSGKTAIVQIRCVFSVRQMFFLHVLRMRAKSRRSRDGMQVPEDRAKDVKMATAQAVSLRQASMCVQGKVCGDPVPYTQTLDLRTSSP